MDDAAISGCVLIFLMILPAGCSNCALLNKELEKNRAVIRGLQKVLDGFGMLLACFCVTNTASTSPSILTPPLQSLCSDSSSSVPVF